MKHILIDFENTRPEAEQLNKLSPEDCHIWLFLGALQQKTLSVDLCEALCRFGKQVHFVRIARSGKNALDFYLAYYLGKITEQDNAALICILSRDTGFDVLIEHLENNGLCQGIVRLGEVSDAARLTEETALPAIPRPIQAGEDDDLQKIPTKDSAQEIFRLAMIHLRQEDVFLPKSRNNLEKNLHKLASDHGIVAETKDITAIVDKMLERKFITIDSNGLLVYHTKQKDLVARIVQRVALSKPKTIDALRNVLRSQANMLFLQQEERDLEIFINYCQAQDVLLVEGNKIKYPPFTEKLVPIMDSEFEKQSKLFFAKFQKNKPKKRDSLIASLKALLKINDIQTEKLLEYLQNKQYIAISTGGKILYT